MEGQLRGTRRKVVTTRRGRAVETALKELTVLYEATCVLYARPQSVGRPALLPPQAVSDEDAGCDNGGSGRGQAGATDSYSAAILLGNCGILEETGRRAGEEAARKTSRERGTWMTASRRRFHACLRSLRG